MNTHVVLGLGFGDEGKGLITDYLCHQTKNPLVVRFCGGHQAGHTVVVNGNRHVFSSFGSGTLRGVPTYWSKNCTVFPIALVREHEALAKFKVPSLFVDAMAPVTTYYDIMYNQVMEKIMDKKSHGSVGLGFGATIERNLTPYKLYVNDLAFPIVLHKKLKAIGHYYDSKIRQAGIGAQIRWDEYDMNTANEEFLQASERCTNIISIGNEKTFLRENKFDNIIFEGSQGILLDMDFGFFPHVTRSNTTSKNAIEFIERNGLPMPEIYYVTRSYLTRHGNGWMPNEKSPFLNIEDNPNETNQKHEFQGEFRKGVLDIELLDYAMITDNYFSSGCKKHLAITCLDQFANKSVERIAATEGAETHYLSAPQLANKLLPPFESLLLSHSDCSENITKKSLL